MTWKLQAITGDITGQEISITHDMLVGRHQDADVLLQSAEISRRHAALLLKDQGLWVQDLNSSNGTFVNNVKIDHETLLKDGDILQFASLKFSILAPVADVVQDDKPEVEMEPVIESTQSVVVEKTAAEQMNEQGMPSLTERAEVPVSREGMPQRVDIPKPAPIPETVQPKVQPEPQSVPLEQPVSRVAEEKEQQKNASVGLMTVIVLIILAVIAWVFFK